MLKKILIGLTVIIIAVVIVVAMQPDTFHIERSATLNAPVDAVFPQVYDLHRWNSWSPWAKLDPNAKNNFEGPRSGTGAKFGWSGNGKIGEGRMTITESRPNEFVQFRLDFVKPFAGTNVAQFTFKPEGKKTLVTWSMTGKQNFISKAMGVVINCDKMIGGFFEQGLAQLETVARAAAKN